MIFIWLYLHVSELFHMHPYQEIKKIISFKEMNIVRCIDISTFTIVGLFHATRYEKFLHIFELHSCCSSIFII